MGGIGVLNFVSSPDFSRDISKNLFCVGVRLSDLLRRLELKEEDTRMAVFVGRKHGKREKNLTELRGPSCSNNCLTDAGG